MAEKTENRISLSVLGDLDVEQCVDEMFLTLAPRQTRTAISSLPTRNQPQRFLRMVSPRQPLGPASPPLPHELREELLGLCAEIVRTAKVQKLQTLMICGVEPGVGASFLAQHLSNLLAEFRRSRIALLTVKSAKEQRRAGARTSVMRRDFEYVLFRTERPNLMEIASAQGAITLNELLSSLAASVALRQMQQEFDFIVIDAPAVAMYTEVALLAAMLDGVILVAEQHVTPLRQMDRAYNRLHQAQANVLGIVLNRQKRA